MQTAMQELINEIVEHLTYDDDLTEDSRIALETIRLRCLGKLEMEKQQIIDAFIEGSDDGFYGFGDSNREKYYNETYGSKGSDECQFEVTTNTSSATICKHCGREKFLHKQ